MTTQLFAFGPIRKLSSGEFSGPLPEGASRKASDEPLDTPVVNQAAAAWVGARIAPAGGRQARPDLTRVKSGKKKQCGEAIQ